MKNWIIAFTLIISVEALAKLNCKGNMFTKLDNGNISFERVRFVPTPSFEKTLTTEQINGRPYFNFEKKSDEWTYYSYLDQEEMFESGYRQRPPGALQYSDMNFDRESFLKFKDKSIVGFNLVCRM
ncbi:MAG: hypothetical protein V4596_07365 [Bdellovibrionota bacterium]